MTYLVANLEDSTSFIGDEEIPQPTALNRIGAMTSAVILRLFPAIPFEDTYTGTTIGGILAYRGPTVMIEGDDEHLGLEVREDDLLFACGSGVWIGTTRYEDMPPELEEYDFITSGTRGEYFQMVEDQLEEELYLNNRLAMTG